MPMMKAAKPPQIDMPGVAARLEAIRIHFGLDKGEFSLSFGLDPSSYSKVLASTKPLKSDYGHAISVRWGVSMDFIYRGDLSKMAPDMRDSLIAILNRVEA